MKLHKWKNLTSIEYGLSRQQCLRCGIRKLATVRRILKLAPIPDADRIEVATVDGWNVVVQKGLYEVGDLACYLEVDSWVPTTLVNLTKDGHFPKVYNEVEGERLKTVKLRGQLSQGLLIPLNELYGKLQGINDYFDGQDVTEIHFDPLKYWAWASPSEPVSFLRKTMP